MVQKGILLLLSFFIVAFGQPAWSSYLSLLAAAIGYSLFWKVLLDIPSAKERFIIGMGWYAAVQVVQLSWFLSHPYFYIYGVLLFCAWLMGAQWGFLSLWIVPKNLKRFSTLLGLAGLWTLLEWSRLFILSGLPFNPVGLSLSAALYPLQLASVGGVYGLSFWVILTNLLVLRWSTHFNSRILGITACAALAFPYFFGGLHVFLHSSPSSSHLDVVLVQSALPIEEKMTFQSAQEARQFVLNEWEQVLGTLKKQQNEKIDLIVLPEYLVPYGTFYAVFPYKEIQFIFSELFGENALSYLPIDSPYIQKFEDRILVSNAYISEAIANLFKAHVVIGLEDNVYLDREKRKAEAYSSAFHFAPDQKGWPKRYDKQILVPMGEYIPFEWAQKLASKYGIAGSFTCGKGPCIFNGPVRLGPSICYEEIYGNIMRKNRLEGAELLVNLTNDGWYPHSLLPQQHFDHARLRTVENGIPLVRACNTGITGGIDSLGRVIDVLNPDLVKDRSDSLRLKVPLHHYETFYAKFGDLAIVLFSFMCLLSGYIFFKNE